LNNIAATRSRPRAALGLILGIAVAALIVAFLTNRQAATQADHYRLGMLALQQGRIAEAEAAWRELRRAHGDSLQATTLRAAIALRADRRAEALTLLNGVPAEGDLRTAVLLIRGEALYRLGRLSEAGHVFRELLASAPAHVDAHRWLGAIYYDLGAMELAIAEMQEVVRLEPADYRPHRLIGLIHRDFEHYGEAVPAYQAALANDPPDDIRTEIRFELADSLTHLHRYEEALAALPSPPPDARTFALQAECLSNLGRAPEAMHAIEEGLERDASDRDVRLVSAQLELDAGHAGKAIELLQGVLTDDPHDFRARYELAGAFRQGGDEAASEAELARVEASRELYARLAALNQEAIQKPADPGVRDELAQICNELGKPELAEMWSRAAQACRDAGSADQQSGMARGE
jgi:tetratricopeptide (TPR) repeat protein